MGDFYQKKRGGVLLYVIVLCILQLHTTIKLYTGGSNGHDCKNF